MDIRKDLNLGWILVYHEMSLKLLEYKNNRQPLVEMIRDCYKSNLFTDMCPLTALNLLNLREKEDARNKRLNHYSDFFEVELDGFTYPPLDDTWKETIPLALPLLSDALFFNPKTTKKPAIDKLWDMFEASLEYADSGGKNKKEFIKNYDTVEKMKGITSLRLSKILYTLRPYTFPTLDGNAIIYLKLFHMAGMFNNDILAMKDKSYRATKYLNIATALVDEFADKYGKKSVFIGLSNAAYVDTGPRKQTR